MLKKAILSLFLACTALPGLASDDRLVVSGDDKVVNAAINQARATLGKILTKVPKQGVRYPATFMLRVKFPGNSLDYEYEVVWVKDVAPLPRNSFQGVLRKAPTSLEGKTEGSTVVFHMDQVVDWSLDSGGKLYGNYTTRAMLPRMQQDKVARLRRILSAHPMP